MNQISKQQLIAVIAILGFVFILLEWIVAPTIKHKEKLREEISKNEVRLEELLDLEAQLRAVRGSSSESSDKSKRDQDFTLFAFLERQANRQGLKDNIEFMRPSTRQVSDSIQERVVEMRLNDIYITELVPYLYHVENAPEKVHVKRMTIRKQDQKDAPLNVDLIFATTLSSSA
jgi:general secretion pathway protein M